MEQYTGIHQIIRPMVADNGSEVALLGERWTQEKIVSLHGQDHKVVISVQGRMYRFQVFVKRMYKYSLLIDRCGLDEQDIVNEWLHVEKNLALQGQ